MGNVKENFKRSCLNGRMIAAVVIPLALFAESLYEGGLLQKTDVDILSAIICSLHVCFQSCRLLCLTARIRTVDI